MVVFLFRISHTPLIQSRNTHHVLPAAVAFSASRSVVPYLFARRYRALVPRHFKDLFFGLPLFSGSVLGNLLG